MKRLVLAAALALSSSVAFASSCPKHMKAIDAALPAAKLSVEEGVTFVGRVEVNPNKIAATPPPPSRGLESPKGSSGSAGSGPDLTKAR